MQPVDPNDDGQTMKSTSVVLIFRASTCLITGWLQKTRSEITRHDRRIGKEESATARLALLPAPTSRDNTFALLGLWTIVAKKLQLFLVDSTASLLPN